MRRLRFLLVLPLVTSSVFVAASPPPTGRTALQRDLESYAIAACLTQQDQAYLKDQGYGWAGVIIQGRNRDPARFTAIDRAVKAELAKGGLPIIRDESAPMKDKTLPIMYCGEIIDTTGVRAAIRAQLLKRRR
jgi:hypothetical protein